LVINTWNFYGAANVAVDSHVGTQVTGMPAAGDADALLEYVERAGLADSDLERLRVAVEADRQSGEPTLEGWARTRAWFEEAGTLAGTGVLAGTLTPLALAFLGIHT
jgi:hypothetical protein